MHNYVFTSPSDCWPYTWLRTSQDAVREYETEIECQYANCSEVNGKHGSRSSGSCSPSTSGSSDSQTSRLLEQHKRKRFWWRSHRNDKKTRTSTDYRRKSWLLWSPSVSFIYLNKLFNLEKNIIITILPLSHTCIVAIIISLTCDELSYEGYLTVFLDYTKF